MADTDGVQCADAATLYVCPETRAPLALEGDSLAAGAGGRRYPIHHGVPDFRTAPPVETPPGTEKLEQLNESSRERGWEAALAMVYADNADLRRYIADPRRSMYLNLLPLAPSSVVLEIGPGLGQFTSQIARQCRFVYALEVVMGQAMFVAQRCEQSGAGNVSVACGGDDCRLPYCSESIDLVVCNLVFEWCASRDRNESPEQGQERLLKELARVLKPGGVLYLSTKNRYALSYLLGRPDEHVYGMRFGNALPRWLMRAALKRRGKDRPAGLLHSHTELNRMLTCSGFTDVKSFWAAPEMRFPDRYIPNEADAIRAARREGGFAQGHTRLTRLLMPFIPPRLVKHFSPGLAFLVRKAAGGQDKREVADGSGAMQRSA